MENRTQTLKMENKIKKVKTADVACLCSLSIKNEVFSRVQVIRKDRHIIYIFMPDISESTGPLEKT
jgi:hypothetical protein